MNQSMEQTITDNILYHLQWLEWADMAYIDVEMEMITEDIIRLRKLEDTEVEIHV